jgi:ATP-dependent Clp protease ATP-binding subunit ClpB
MQIEAAALAQESSADSKQRLQELRRQIADREEGVNALKTRWQIERRPCRRSDR